MTALHMPPVDPMRTSMPSDMSHIPGKVCALPGQAVCWGAKAWQSWLHALAAALLVLCLNVFGGLALAHSYLAATGQTTYELVKGAKVGTLTPGRLQGAACSVQSALHDPHEKPLTGRPSSCNASVPVMMAEAMQHLCLDSMRGSFLISQAALQHSIACSLSPSQLHT